MGKAMFVFLTILISVLLVSGCIEQNNQIQESRSIVITVIYDVETPETHYYDLRIYELSNTTLTDKGLKELVKERMFEKAEEYEVGVDKIHYEVFINERRRKE